MRPRRNIFSQNIRARSAELLNKQLTSAIDLDVQVKRAPWDVPERQRRSAKRSTQGSTICAMSRQTFQLRL